MAHATDNSNHTAATHSHVQCTAVNHAERSQPTAARAGHLTASGVE